MAGNGHQSLGDGTSIGAAGGVGALLHRLRWALGRLVLGSSVLASASCMAAPVPDRAGPTPRDAGGPARAIEAGATGATGAEPSGLPADVITGLLTGEGVMCPAMRGDDGELYVFDLLPEPLAPGMRIAVEPADREPRPSSCDQGALLVWKSITKIGADGAPERSWTAD